MQPNMAEADKRSNETRFARIVADAIIIQRLLALGLQIIPRPGGYFESDRSDN